MRTKSTDLASDICRDRSGTRSLRLRRTRFRRARAALHRSSWWLRSLVLTLGLALGLSGQLTVEAAAQPSDSETASEGTPEYTTVDSVQLGAMLETKTFFFVNVHIPYEGEIEGTDALIAFDRIVDNLDKLPADKGADIVLYCMSGRMSEIAAQELSRLGYTRVSHLAGGMIDWEKNGGEILEK